MEKTYEIGNMCATVEVTYKEVDASFDHAFGTRKETDLEVDDYHIVRFERWDNEGNTISIDPSKEDLHLIDESIS